MDLRSTLWPVSRSSLLGSPRTEVPIYRSTSLPHPTPANPAFNGLPLAVYSIPHPHQRPRARLTVEKGADPGTRPAPRGCACLARAPYLRRLLIGFWGAARALRDGGGAGWVGWRRGGSTTSYLPANGVWGARRPEEVGRKPAPVTPEPAWASRKRHPGKARPKEEEVSRGQPELRSREREHPAEHALLEVVGLSTHADTRGGGVRALRLRLSARARRWEPAWVCRDYREGGSGDIRFESRLVSGFGGMRWGWEAGRNFNVLD